MDDMLTALLLAKSRPNKGAEVAKALAQGFAGQAYTPPTADSTLSTLFLKKALDRDDPLYQARTKYYQSKAAGTDKEWKPSTVDKALGTLTAGGYVDKMTGRAIKFRNRQDAMNYALTSLGADWESDAPRAMAIINQKWPEIIEQPEAVPARGGFDWGEAGANLRDFINTKFRRKPRVLPPEEAASPYAEDEDIDDWWNQ